MIFSSEEASANRLELVLWAPAATPADVDTRLMAAVDIADEQPCRTLTELGTDPAKYV